MPIVRTIARTQLDPLIPRFEEIRARAGIEIDYAEAVLADSRAGNQDAELDHVHGPRIDATEIDFVTIDPAGSRDLDQALNIVESNGGFLIRYAIADVGAQVVPGSALDKDTRKRVETVYCPDRRVGLHPPHMSEGYASLLPGQRTKAVLWSMHLMPEGHLREVEVKRAWVTSRRQYSYAELEHALPPEASELVAHMRQVGDLRRQVLRERGAVSLARPSQEVRVEDGHATLEFRAARGIEDDNAQISLLTGMAAAKLMLDHGVGVLRTMPPATQAATERLRRQAKALGVEWADGVSYGDLMDTLDPDSPGTAAFLSEAVTLFRGASWEPFHIEGNLPLPTELTHGALAAPYAHVTAPLRRLVDRYGAEICLAVSSGTEVPHWVLEALPSLGARMSSGVDRGSQVERACIDAVEEAMLRPHLGEVFVGVGLDDRTVQLASPAVIARCAGGVAPGVEQRVRLVSAAFDEGTRFEVVDGAQVAQ